MAKSKVEEIVDFIGSVEQGTVTCAWSTTKQLPRDISILDFSSIQLNATTDLAINCAKMGITNKQEDYKKNKYSSYPNKYGKDDRKGRDFKKRQKIITGLQKIL